MKDSPFTSIGARISGSRFSLLWVPVKIAELCKNVFLGGVDVLADLSFSVLSSTLSILT